jgi:hypothetical protein
VLVGRPVGVLTSGCSFRSRCPLLDVGIRCANKLIPRQSLDPVLSLGEDGRFVEPQSLGSKPNVRHVEIKSLRIPTDILHFLTHGGEPSVIAEHSTSFTHLFVRQNMRF